MSALWGALAAEGYVEEFEKELAWRGLRPVGVRERFYLFEGEPVALWWSAVTWLAISRLEVPSIGVAAKLLKPLAKKWVLCSTGHHRRAALIAEQLRLAKDEPQEFPFPALAAGAFTLWEPNEVLWCKRFDRLHPLGLAQFRESKEAPSRAYLKLWEGLSLRGELPQPGEKCLELGASPGGWTWVIARLGASVLAVDRAPLAPLVASMPGVSFRSGDAFALKPERDGPVDWLFSDLICYPEKLFEFLGPWIESGAAARFLCTIKFQGESDPELIARFAALGRVLHLHHNKHELTWIR